MACRIQKETERACVSLQQTQESSWNAGSIWTLVAVTTESTVTTGCPFPFNKKKARCLNMELANDVHRKERKLSKAMIGEGVLKVDRGEQR